MACQLAPHCVRHFLQNQRNIAFNGQIMKATVYQILMKIHLLPILSSMRENLCMTIAGILTCLLQIWQAVFLQLQLVTIQSIFGIQPLLRCTYRAYDAMDEIAAAFSIAFNPTGNKIFAGYNKTLRVFDVHRPGRDFVQRSTLQGSKEGQSGIISAIAFSPAHTGMFATGSYDRTTAIYREDNMELLYVLHGQEGGITHAQFSKDGNYLYTGARKDPYIMCWDVRNTVEVVYKLYRSTEQTNQRISFDIEPCGRHLGTGGQDGLVHIYDLQTGQWMSSFAAASDTVNGFSFHPFLPMAVTSSGHRRFGLPVDADDEEEAHTLTEYENCASVWSFTFDTAEEDAVNINGENSDVNFVDEES